MRVVPGRVRVDLVDARIARMGIDSLAVLTLYTVGIRELIALAYACPADHVPVLASPR
ncbi:hypothetical protein [Streptomyces sp. H39-S7]|uniref:hypothetical protein n=1 Tax=Streptomyces sp. H39-S7 TaxID=3004357 RepID=UPI0022AEE43F|nr:hypothetical protein [Streptomyces sp. H39-S7]MCZ4126120.1 hypothetical protein [Streptomyces sp. H39-S7]